jgi:hypothetical protein
MRWSRGVSKYATNFKIYPVWLNRDDIIKVLRLVGLLPPLAAPSDDEGKKKSDRPKSPRGEVEQWVYDRMKNDGSPRMFDRSYVSDLYDDTLRSGIFDVGKGRIGNIVGSLRNTEFPALKPTPARNVHAEVHAKCTPSAR